MGLLSALAKAVPVVGPLAGAAIEGIGALKRNNAAKDAARLANQNIAAENQAKQSVLAGLRAAGWNPMGVNTLNSGSSGTSTTNQRQHTDTYQRNKRITEAPDQAMEAKLRELVMGRLAAPQQISASERLNAVRNINQANAGALAAIRNTAGQRGLVGAQYGSALTPIQSARAGQISSYLGTTVPEQERALAAQARGEASNFLNERAGSEQFGTQDTTGTSTTNQSQSGFHQVGPDIQGALGLMVPTAQVSNQTGQSALLTGGSALLNGLAGIDWNRNKKPTTPTTPMVLPQGRSVNYYTARP